MSKDAQNIIKKIMIVISIVILIVTIYNVGEDKQYIYEDGKFLQIRGID